jgi:murein L,D-transpeptidase YcbB/YkuD
VVNPANVSRQMLLSGNYRVAQKGGAGNSLGRIVFRFKNRYSVYLHDTSTPSAFQRDVRSLSHGCVRVSKPFELANFVLGNPDEWLLDRIRIGMGQQAQTDQGRQWLRAHPDKGDLKKLIGYVGVKPHVPLYIIYNTMWPDENGVWREWPDVYGYDDVIWKQMQPYMQ